MLSRSDIDIKAVMADLAHYGIEAAFLVPTKTGLDKSIIDAHDGLRKYLKKHEIHNYELQSQGPTSKVILEGNFINENGIMKTKISLYRPETKSGDPRIWFSGLNSYASANNLLVVLIANQEIFLINASRSKIWETLNVKGSPLNEIILKLSSRKSLIEEELLKKLIQIHLKGFVASTTNADSGVGDTLENLLKIKRNSNRAPDYKGIEIKASRVSGRTQRSSNRSNLFSKIPNWELSELKNGEAILNKFGYYPPGSPSKKALHVTLNNNPNAQNLYLAIDLDNYYVENLYKSKTGNEKVVLWKLDELESELEKKHENTFWVKAESKNISNLEHFHYKFVEATSNPMVTNFGTLVETGSITLDYTFSEKTRASGKSYARDHGYLWKIKPTDFGLLFPPKRIFDLSTPLTI